MISIMDSDLNNRINYALRRNGINFYDELVSLYACNNLANFLYHAKGIGKKSRDLIYDSIYRYLNNTHYYQMTLDDYLEENQK